jgi:hypothetical protein
MNNKILGIDFKDSHVEGYRNINELFPQHEQLHACETLFGDFDARVMVLAQDAANFKTLESLYQKDPKSNPFRHGEKVETNINLFNLLNSQNIFDLGTFRHPNNRSCGVYYANAIWLLKDSEGMSGAITSKRAIYQESKNILEATIKNLEKLRLVVTMGRESFGFIKSCYPNEIRGEWPEVVSSRGVSKFNLNGIEYLVGSIYHLSRRGLIGRSRQEDENQINPLTKGFELTCKDLQQIFINAAIL